MSAPPPPEPAPLRAPAGTPLYLHLPFCATKCPYCDFYSVVGDGQDLDALVEDLLREAAARAPMAPRTVFLGGGTPSYLDSPRLTRLLDGIDALTGFRASAVEVTAECNPESLDQAKAETLLALGVGRLSIGFQSLDPETLVLFGRVHDVAQSFAAFQAARSAGCKRLSVDLIYGAPGQTPDACRDELRRVADLGPEHISAYNLTYEEGTPFEAWRRQGLLERAPEELELELFHTVRATLADAGFDAYEISNFARPGEPCLHNINYWHNGPYVGIGPSAASFVRGRRCASPRSLSAWRADVRASGRSEAWSEVLEETARLGETWWLGLRLAAGLTPHEARVRAGLEPRASRDSGSDRAAALAADLAAEGLLFATPEPGSPEPSRALASQSGPDAVRYRLSERGLPLADAVAREFLALAGLSNAAAPLP